jgi:hypothetical protein
MASGGPPCDYSVNFTTTVDVNKSVGKLAGRSKYQKRFILTLERPITSETTPPNSSASTLAATTPSPTRARVQ